MGRTEDLAALDALDARIASIRQTMAGLEQDGASAVSGFGQSATYYPLGALRSQLADLRAERRVLIGKIDGHDYGFGSVTPQAGA